MVIAISINFNLTPKMFTNRKLLYLCTMFNIIARRTLLYYCKKYPDAATSLQEWYHELVQCDFKSFQELRKKHGNASEMVRDTRGV